MVTTIINGPRKSGKSTLADGLRTSLHLTYGSKVEIYEVDSVAQAKEHWKSGNEKYLDAIILVADGNLLLTEEDIPYAANPQIIHTTRGVFGRH